MLECGGLLHSTQKTVMVYGSVQAYPDAKLCGAVTAWLSLALLAS